MQNKKLYLKYFIYIFNNLFIFVNAFGFLLNACINEVTNICVACCFSSTFLVRYPLNHEAIHSFPTFGQIKSLKY